MGEQSIPDLIVDLLRDNARVVADIGRTLAGFDGTIVLVSNPVDVLTQVMTEASGLPPARVLGTGTLLDTSRLRQMLGRRLQLATNSIHAQVVGEHGDSEVVLWSGAHDVIDGTMSAGTLGQFVLYALIGGGSVGALAEVRRQLGPDGDRVQGVFVTVDPERDTPELLKGYLGSMDPSFVGLTGTPDEIKAAAKEFKVFYQKVPTDNGNYTIDHTAGAFVFDPSGKVRLFVRYGMPVEDLLADIRQLL